MAHHIYEVPKPPSLLRPDLSAAVSDAILWMLAKDKEARPQSLAEAIRGLEEAAAGVSARRESSARTRPVAPSGLRQRREEQEKASARRRRALLLAAGLGAAALGLAGAAMLARPPAEPVPMRPEAAAAAAPAPAAAPPAPPAPVEVRPAAPAPEGARAEADHATERRRPARKAKKPSTAAVPRPDDIDKWR
jgi:hypothetical protein